MTFLFRRGLAIVAVPVCVVAASLALGRADAARTRRDIGPALSMHRGASSESTAPEHGSSTSAWPPKPRASRPSHAARTSATGTTTPRTTTPQTTAPRTIAPRLTLGRASSAAPRLEQPTAIRSGAPAAAGPSGQLRPRAVPAGWTLAFTDDFIGSRLGNAWYAYQGVPGGDTAGQFAKSHILVSNGMAQLRGYRDAAYGNKLTTAGISTGHGFVQTYGKYLVRMRADSGKGVSYVALLWPAEGHSWPPEIDFAEDNGEVGRKTVTSTMHWKTPTVKHGQRSLQTKVDMTNWHTVGVEWLPGRVTYTIDGRPWATLTGKDVSSVPMALALQTQAWYCGNSWQSCPDRSTPERIDMQVDWVVAYRPKE